MDLETRVLYRMCRSIETQRRNISFFEMLVLGAAFFKSPNLNQFNIFSVFAFSGHLYVK